MKVVKKTGEDGHIKLDVTASSSEVSEALQQASISFCGQMGIQPYGNKTPAELANEALGIKNLDSVVATQAVEMLVPRALNKHGIIPAFNPTPQADAPIRRGHAYQFTLEVLPKPSFELDDYSPVTIRVQPFEEDESEIDRQISGIARNYISWVPAEGEGPLKSHDSCKIKIEATKNGEIVPGLTSDGRVYTLGEKLMPEGFDEAIEGMMVGETRNFTFEGPGLDENKNEVMEEYKCEITLLEMQREVVPVIDDEWISKFLPMYSSLEELRSKIGEQVNADRKKYYEDYKRNLAAAALSERFKGTIPDEIYEGSMAQEQRTLRQQVAASGQTWEQFCEQQGGEQQVGMMLMVSMRQSLVQGYCLDAYYRHYNLSYTEEDLDESCFQLNPRNPRGVRQQMEKNGLGFALRESAERLRACKHLVEHAEIIERPASEGGPSLVMA